MGAEQGTALFLILIAVALFAALSYAVTQSGRGSGTIDKESIFIDSSKIVQYAGQVSTAVSRIKVAGGCSDTQISFENTVVAGYTNATSPADYRCHVFRPEGGNVTFQAPPANTNDGSAYVFTGQSPVEAVGTTDTGTLCAGAGSASCAELVILLPGISEAMCRKVQTLSGNSPTGVYTTEDNGPGTVKFQGVYGYTGMDIDGSGDGPTSAVNDGKLMGCTKGNDGRYYFYNVLLSR